ncbi:calcineurin-like phosphoesterase family protein [Tumebacillus sp. BK434]|uniref:metallophosphoesterase family protein n=1 Tax=Tumebacillus sp. BK434 TaxID=2512169 RepID=UPI001052A09F|nr:metallophosphoesterase [Tumebacillus sp. BK434]TCP55439.1 calcineurin-like phosphoesterase family protein [Tumebacillus sp. BK434]
MRQYFAFALCMLLMAVLLIPGTGFAGPRQLEEPLLQFAVFSDVHVMAEWSIDHYKSTFKFTHALRDIAPLKPDFLVINGDLSNGRPKDLELVRKLLKANGNFKLYPTMGNHEYYYQWEMPDWNDDRAKAVFRKTFGLGKLYYDHVEQGAHFIHLSPEQYMAKQKEIGEAAWLSDEQLRWFEKTLLGSKAPTFVFLHQPLDRTVGKTDRGISAVQTRQLLAIAQKHPQVVWFSGHSHVSITAPTEFLRQDNITFVGLGSVYQPIVGMSADHFKSESRFVELYRDRIVIRDRLHHKNSFGAAYTIPISDKSLLTP